MEALLERFSGKIDAKGLVATVERIKRDYVADGLTKEDVPPIVSEMMMLAAKMKNLTGQEKKRLVVGVLNHLISEIEQGEEDTEFERTLKRMVPAMVDSFAAMLKAKAACLSCFKCCKK